MTGALQVLRACARRDYELERSYSLTFVFTPIGGVVSLLPFFYISKLVGNAVGHDGALTHGYFAFVVVGLLVSRVAELLLLAIPSRIRQDQLTGALEAVLSTPAAPAVVALGYGLYDLFRVSLDTTLSFALAIVVFGLPLDLTADRVGAALAGLVAILVLFAAIGVAVAGLVIAFKRVQRPIGVVASLMALLGTVFVPTDTLPAGLQELSRLNPLTWALALIRPVTTSQEVPWNRLAWLLACCAAAVPLAVMTVDWGIAQAKRRGTLGQY
jgi:ABC-2 type transport system permease protein